MFDIELAAMSVVGFACVVSVLVSLRNNRVYSVRHWFKWDAPDHDMYDRLPGYCQMVFHPKHLHRWTVKQWVKYVEANRG